MRTTVRADQNELPANATPQQKMLQQLRNQGLALHKQGKIPEAIAAYDKFLSLVPGDAGIWSNLGVALRTQNKWRAAEACYRRAAALDPNWAGIWSNLGNVLRDLDEFEEAERCHKRAMELDPKDPAHYHHIGTVLRAQGKIDEAISFFKRGLAIDPKHTMSRWDLSRMQLLLGDYENGWANYEVRWQLEEMHKRPFPKPRWDGGRLDGKTILLYAEQGFGDTIMAARFIPFVKKLGAKKVIFECQQPLMRIMQDVEGIDQLIPRDTPHPEYDVQSTIMSLPYFLKVTFRTMPPPMKVSIPEEARQKMRPYFEPYQEVLKVGIIWSGSVTFKNNRRRSSNLESFLRFAAIPGVQLFSLQKGPPFDQYKDLQCNSMVIDIGSHANDFADTAAAIEQLDLVLMTDSSVVHLTGSIGKPCWDLLDFESYFIYLLHGEQTPWYPSVRLFRQRFFNDWDGLFERAESSLRALAYRFAEGRRAARAGEAPKL